MVKIEKSKPIWLVPVVVLFLLVFQQFASRAGGFVANSFSYAAIDPYNVFAWISVHHIVQTILALAVIGILAITKKFDFGFRLGDAKVGLKLTLDFTILVLIINIVYFVINFFYFSFSGPDFPLNLRNVAGTLGFQLLLSSAEEIGFRALPIALLVYSFKTSKSIKIGKSEVSLATIIAAVLFTLAHVRWSINPVIINFCIIQLVISFVYGIYYGVAFEKSKSVLYPMIMHGISNVLAVGVLYILSVFFQIVISR